LRSRSTFSSLIHVEEDSAFAERCPGRDEEI
jgi:hypothetical protein